MNKRRLIQIILWVCLLAMLPTQSFAQTADLSDEILLGFNYRSSILDAYPEVKGTEEDLMTQLVFKRLLSTNVSRLAPALPYKVTVIDSNMINAFSAMGGQVYIPVGMAKLIGEDHGLMAAVLGHEIAHCMGRHQYKAFVRAVQLEQQREYYRRRAAQGDSSASWALIGLNIVGGTLNLKMSRDEEHEADRIGLMMMVEAGYHPAFAISLYRKLSAKLGDESKLSAFFSDHPRWATREERALKVYEDALFLFDVKWPNDAESPGGKPPLLGSIGKVNVKELKQEKAVQIQVPYNIRHGKGERVFAVAVFFTKNGVVPSAMSEYQGKDGDLIAKDVLLPTTENENGTFTLKIPSAALGIKDRKVKARVGILDKSGILDSSKEITVNFPKP